MASLLVRTATEGPQSMRENWQSREDGTWQLKVHRAMEESKTYPRRPQVVPATLPKPKVLPAAMLLYASAWSATYTNETCGSDLWEALRSPRPSRCSVSALEPEPGCVYYFSYGDGRRRPHHVTKCLLLQRHDDVEPSVHGRGSQ